MFRSSITRLRIQRREALKHYRVLKRLKAKLGVWRLVRLPWLFYKGLLRVFTVLDFGRFLSGAGKPTQSSTALAAVQDRQGLLSVLEQEFTLKRVTAYGHVESRVLFFGATANNEREFDFLSAKTGHLGFTYSRVANLSFAEKLRHVDGQDDLSCKLFLSRLVEYFSRRLVCNPGTADILLNYCRYFYRLFRFFLQDPKRLPVIAVMANDHSASTVAFSMVMKLFNVPRVYLQHAEVSPRFPALDFEYAVLRNSHSAQVYQRAGRSKARVYIVARQTPAVGFDRLFKPTAGHVTVVIYLTAVFLPAQLQAAVEALSCNSDVANVQIKLHPRTSPALRAAIAHLALVAQRPDAEHVAIVANSSMSIELLSAGVKVFQLFTLDDIGADYYGFVASGLTPEVSIGDLEEGFWRRSFYTEEWRATMAGYDPALGRSADDLQLLLRDLAAYSAVVR